MKGYLGIDGYVNIVEVLNMLHIDHIVNHAATYIEKMLKCLGLKND
tara:strand:+ start:1244 stop:1381 length:138 start_codon:yes stop_codon:yes gene_type:complete